MKKIFAIALLFITFVLLGSKLEQDDLNNYSKTYKVGETYVANEMYLTFSDVLYEKNKTTVIFDFENKLDVEQHFTYRTNGSENYVSRYIEYASLSINDEEAKDRYAYGIKEENQKDNLYLIKPLEKGTIVITYNERIESTADYSKNYEFLIQGFLDNAVAFKDTRPFIEMDGTE